MMEQKTILNRRAWDAAVERNAEISAWRKRRTRRLAKIAARFFFPALRAWEEEVKRIEDARTEAVRLLSSCPTSGAQEFVEYLSTGKSPHSVDFPVERARWDKRIQRARKWLSEHMDKESFMRIARARGSEPPRPAFTTFYRMARERAIRYKIRPFFKG